MPNGKLRLEYIESDLRLLLRWGLVLRVEAGKFSLMSAISRLSVAAPAGPAVRSKIGAGTRRSTPMKFPSLHLNRDELLLPRLRLMRDGLWCKHRWLCRRRARWHTVHRLAQPYCYPLGGCDIFVPSVSAMEGRSRTTGRLIFKWM